MLVHNVLDCNVTCNSFFVLLIRTFKKKAPRAIKAIRKFAFEAMGTKDVRLETDVNKYIWKNGIHNIPNRLRVRLSRKRNDDEEATEKV